MRSGSDPPSDPSSSGASLLSSTRFLLCCLTSGFLGGRPTVAEPAESVDELDDELAEEDDEELYTRREDGTDYVKVYHALSDSTST